MVPGHGLDLSNTSHTLWCIGNIVHVQILTQCFGTWHPVFVTGSQVMPRGRQSEGGRPKGRLGAGWWRSSVSHKGAPPKVPFSILSQPIQNSEIHLQRDGTPGHYHSIWGKGWAAVTYKWKLSRSLKLSLPCTQNCFFLCYWKYFTLMLWTVSCLLKQSKLDRTWKKINSSDFLSAHGHTNMHMYIYTYIWMYMHIYPYTPWRGTLIIRLMTI